MSLEGDRFFYANPLVRDDAPPAPRKRETWDGITYGREPWFGCACCPTNAARLLASLGGYLYAQGPGALWVHLYAAGEAACTVGGRRVRLRVRTRYPWDGKVTLLLEPERPFPFTLHLRIPGWCRNPSLRGPDGPVPLGRALRRGIMAARGRFCVCDEIDLCDIDFYRSSLGLLRPGRADMVIGSKLAPGARDERPLVRRLATRVLSGLLRHGAGLRGTDTHGPKAFRRRAVAPLAEACRVEENLFASELVIRAERAGLKIVELPLVLREKRRPTINLVRRVPRALYNIGRLVWLFRVQEPRRGRDRQP